MTNFTDGKRLLKIKMYECEGENRKPDFENDFFEVGGLEYDEEKNAYIVKDMEYLIEQAEDWKNGVGDYRRDEEEEERRREKEITSFVMYDMTDLPTKGE